MLHALREWTSQLWQELRRLDPHWRFSGLTGELGHDWLVVDPINPHAGWMSLLHGFGGKSFVSEQIPYDLTESPIVHAQTIDRRLHALRTRMSALERMHREAFLQTLERSRTDLELPQTVRDELELWAQRLVPYLENETSITVAQALERYRFDRETGAAHRGLAK